MMIGGPGDNAQISLPAPPLSLFQEDHPLSAKTDRATRLARDSRVGLPARRGATQLVEAVLEKGRPLDNAFAEQTKSGLLSRLAERDRALARAITAMALRRKGQIDAVFNSFLERPLKPKAGPLLAIARTALAEILFMDAPNHAIVNLAVHQARDDRRVQRYAGLLNAVLRRASEKGADPLAKQDAARLNTPAWLWDSWDAGHGEEVAQRIAEANQDEAMLDLTVRSDAPGWAERLGGVKVGATTVRIKPQGRIEALDGFEEGHWWVQDAAAALPARLLGDVAGKRVADLCAAPGSKTAQLALAGADVTAIDISGNRLRRLKDNLERLKLTARVVESDVLDYEPADLFDAVLLDAPCSATGTIRRHPDIAHLKSPTDIERLGNLQRRLLKKAAGLLKPGGVLIYCTCSLQVEEGEQQVETFLAEGVPVDINAIGDAEGVGISHTLSRQGFLRTWPLGKIDSESDAPADGFFCARFTKPISQP